MEYIIKAVFGDEAKEFRLVNHNGNGSSFHIMIDNYYHGSLNLMSTGWKFYFNSGEYTSADCDAILEQLRNLNAI